MYHITAFQQSLFMYWQSIVHIYNFKRKGIDLSKVVLLVEYNDTPMEQFMKLREVTGVQVFFYKKDRNYLYLPTCRPILLEKFFRDFPEMEKEYVLFHDSDIIYREVPNYELMKDGNYYVAPCHTYIGYNYLKQKGETIIHDMCDAVNLDYNLVVTNDVNSGGGQYFGKGLTKEYWGEVANDCETLHKVVNVKKPEYIKELIGYYKTKFSTVPNISDEDYLASLDVQLREHYDLFMKGFPPYNPMDAFYHKNRIQVWTAGMWAELWCLWKHGQNVLETKDLDFSWGTSDFQTYLNRPFLHNAGVMSNMTNLFNKSAYKTRMPFNDDFSSIRPDCASYMYVKELKEAGRYYKTLI
jgi:hypothetical protein